MLFVFQCNRYSLHNAYALPKEQDEQFIKVILEKDANEIENRVDKVRKIESNYVFH
jgi:hypothetical protein